MASAGSGPPGPTGGHDGRHRTCLQFYALYGTANCLIWQFNINPRGLKSGNMLPLWKSKKQFSPSVLGKYNRSSIPDSFHIPDTFLLSKMDIKSKVYSGSKAQRRGDYTDLPACVLCWAMMQCPHFHSARSYRVRTFFQQLPQAQLPGRAIMSCFQVSQAVGSVKNWLRQIWGGRNERWISATLLSRFCLQWPHHYAWKQTEYLIH